MTSLIELNLRAIEEGKIDMLELPLNSLDAYDMDLLDKGYYYLYSFWYGYWF